MVAQDLKVDLVAQAQAVEHRGWLSKWHRGAKTRMWVELVSGARLRLLATLLLFQRQLRQEGVVSSQLINLV